ncbi:hypothetical protein [Pseudonocardia humida]|uniref:Uncharacterized protein n=1 Tax=Pseudonocardia humida TaxID=2800819 RepID=A0ABT1A6M4_9PSEU|nr:hypothetical protein [Pseudonocardia humida]MCO1658384.1 hypothetical protein [Pseudonocardia humida]
MTLDLVALCERQPDAGMTLAAMRACGAELRVNTIERGGLVQLCSPDERPLVTVEGPRLVQVPGEVQRLLGVTDAPHPTWWVEAKAVSTDPEAPRIARRFTAALLSLTGGVSWSSR